MRHFTLTGLLLAATLNVIGLAQAEVRISTVAIDASGRVQVQVPSSSQHYYVLYRRFSPDEAAEQAGSIDELRLYDRALNAAEVAWLAGRTVPFDKP